MRGPELAQELGRLTARHDMSNVYKQILVRLISPEALLGLSQRLFKTYYDCGDFEVIEKHLPVRGRRRLLSARRPHAGMVFSESKSDPVARL